MSRHGRNRPRFSLRTTTTSISEGPTEVSKGPRNRVEMSREDIRALIDLMRDNHTARINDLRDKLKLQQAKLAYIVAICDLNQRTVIEKMVRESFKGIPPEQIRQGTIGSWLVGCLISNTPCSPLCANSIQFSLGGEECKNLLIDARYDRGKYHFQVLKKPPPTVKNPRAYIHVNHAGYEEFLGFDRDELRSLAGYGVERGYLNGVRSGEYVELRRFSSLKDLKERKSTPVTINRQTIHYIIMSVVILVILLALAWLIYRVSTSRRD